MSKCWDCGKKIEDKLFRCENCIKKPIIFNEQEIRRKGLNDWERKKLGWYRSEKKWIESIQNRKLVTGRDGSKIAIDHNGLMPTPPKLPDKKIHIQKEADF